MAPFILPSIPGAEFCSHSCVDTVVAAINTERKKKGSGDVQRVLEEFAGSGIVRHFCDRCGKPITLRWPGEGANRGEYCSAACAGEGPQRPPDTEATVITVVAEPAESADNEDMTATAVVTPTKIRKTKGKAAVKAAKPTKKQKTAPKRGRPKATKPEASVSADNLFRPGTTKAAIFDYLKTGKLRKREDVKAIVTKAGITSYTLINAVMSAAEKNGYQVESSRESIRFIKI